MRLVGRQNPQAESQNNATAPKCNVQILRDKPAASARQVATFKIDGMPSQRDDILTMLKGKACEAGANALLIKDARQEDSEAGSVYHVEAVAFFAKKPGRAAGHAPAPKTITVPPPTQAVPKTITVDSSARR